MKILAGGCIAQAVEPVLDFLPGRVGDQRLVLAALLRRTFDGSGPGEFDTFDADVKLYQDQSLQ